MEDLILTTNSNATTHTEYIYGYLRPLHTEGPKAVQFWDEHRPVKDITITRTTDDNVKIGHFIPIVGQIDAMNPPFFIFPPCESLI